MTQAVAEELGGIPMSPALQATLLRAREYAGGQMHREVTLEHLLLALTEDDDATSVMQACRLDIGRLRNDLAGYLGDLGDRVSAGAAPTISAALTRILKYATLAAKQGRRPKIDGAIVLAAIVGDGKSMAAGFLKAQGLTFEEAVRVLQQSIREGARPAPAQLNAPSPVTPAPGRSSVPQARAPDAISSASQVPLPQLDPPTGPGTGRTPNTDDILAAARQRVMSRAPLPSFYDEQSADQARDTVTQPVQPSLEPPAITQYSEPDPLTTQPAAPATQPPATPPAASWAPPPLPNAPPSDAPSHRPPLPPLMPLGAPPARPIPQRPQWAGAPQPPAAPPWSPSVERQSTASPTLAPPMPSTPLRNGPHPAGPFAPLPPGPTFGPPQTPQLPGAAFPHGSQPPMPSQPAIEASHISHNIPQRMTVGQTRTIEVQVRRTPLAGTATNSRPAHERRDIVTARAISVRFRPAKGRFIIDQPSLETQWDKAVDGTRLAADAAVWRFTVQPMSLGKGEVTLSVSARTVAADGMIMETTLPDQVFEVRTRRNWSRTLTYVGTLALVAVAGIVVASFADVLGVKKLAALLFK